MCTEDGAPEVDGPPTGSRFGGGQLGGRTKEPPPRCACVCSQAEFRRRGILRSDLRPHGPSTSLKAPAFAIATASRILIPTRLSQFATQLVARVLDEGQIGQ